MRWKLVGGWTSALTLLLCGGVARAAEPVMLADGHVDYAARMVAGQLRSQIKDGTQGADQVVWRQPSDARFQVRSSARTTVPEGARLAFLGSPGSAVWLIPQVQRPGILWAGWNTEELSSADVNGLVTWQLEAVQGPGTVAVFQTGAFGAPDVLFNSADGLPDSRQVPLGTHAHGNWAFSRPGSYLLTFRMSAHSASGVELSDVQTLGVQVDGEPGTDPPEQGSSPPSTGAPSTPSNPSTPSTPAGDAKLTLRASGARVQGLRLTFKVRLDPTSRLDVAVRRAGRVVTRAQPRTVAGAARQRTLRVRLGRALKAGLTYRVAIRARADRVSVTRTLTVRIPKR